GTITGPAGIAARYVACGDPVARLPSCCPPREGVAVRPERAAPGGERPTRRRLAWVVLFAGVALVLASGTVVFVLANGGSGTQRATMVEPPVPAPSPTSSQPSASASASASSSPSASASKKPSNGPAGRSNLACPLPKHPDGSCTG